MKNALRITVFFFCFSALNAQSSFKQLTNKPNDNPQPFVPASDIPSMISSARTANAFHHSPLSSIRGTHEAVEKYLISSSGSIWIDLKKNDLWSSRTSVNNLIGDLIPNSVYTGHWNMEWASVSEGKDAKDISHIRVEQMLAGHPIHHQDLVLHIANGQLRDLNGFAWTGPLPDKLPSPASPEAALNSARQFLTEKGIKFQAKPQLAGLDHPEDQIRLTWLPKNGKLNLAYEINIHPNMMDHWTLFVNASTLVIEKSFSQLCSLFPKQLYNIPAKADVCSSHTSIASTSSEKHTASSLVVDGPSTITDQDLLGQTRTVNSYLVGPNFFMIDASRSGMFNGNQSVMPNEPAGVIWTIDGQNGSPQKDNFEVIHVSNTNNNWQPLQVSAHYNAGESYQYFLQKFNRNSLNGDGGNIISIINVADENGNGMDNAFWSGTAMFYGNGDVAFSALAKALDVAGHEMSHGVIQNTANLEYVGQSGALNESFADVFGAMIDRDDWQLGEDVSNTSVFPTGALRDLSNPHNGGNGPNDPGWQPSHMNEFQNLPNTPEGDNGGVHVNSGIANRAFFLLATSIGKDKAEQIYFKALRDYLVKSSQFIDARIAVEKAAGDLHGTSSAEVTAVRNAFDGVGIGAGPGEDHQDDIETNAGDDFIIATDETDSDLYWIPPSNPDQFVKLEVPAPLSRPSFTDDGTSCVYVDQNNDMILINFNWSGGTLNYQAFFLEETPQGIWRNIVVSKDGSKIAYTTSELLNEMWVFDFTSSALEQFFLYNPTSAEGIVTGDVLYADAMEWDYSGEYVMYDALNRIESSFGDGIEYWDISFINVWDNASNNFGDSQVDKLYNSLPENISIGNPSFAKNSPYIITFDFLEEIRDQFGQEQTDYWVIAANIESGTVNNIYQNTTVGYPSYSRLDDQILFTFDNNGALLLATIDIQPGDKTLPVAGSDVILINGAQKGVWFQTGNRDFTSVNDLNLSKDAISVWPQPSHDFIFLKWGDNHQHPEFRITDLSGRQVLSGKLDSGYGIDISSLLPGPYFISLIGDRDFQQAKFVKQ